MSNDPEIIIYTKADGPCSFCEKAKDIFNEHNWSYTELRVGETGILSKEDLRHILSHYGLKPDDKVTVPQIFITGAYIGGYDDLVEHLKYIWYPD